MRIALISSVSIGGAYVFFYNMKQILSDKYDVRIYYRKKFPPGFSWLNSIVPSIIAASTNDIVVSHNVHWQGCVSTVFAKLFRKKSIIFIMGKYYDEAEIRYKNKGIQGALMLRLLSLFECISLHLADIVVSTDDGVTEHLGSKRIKYIFPWTQFGTIDLQQFSYDGHVRSKYREKLGIPNSDPVLIFVGWLATWEGADTAIDLYKRLSKQTTNLWLVLVGSGALEYNIIEMIAREGLNRVVLTGFVPHDEIQNYMLVGDIGVLPLQEPQCGIGSVPIEMMSLGIPIVATDVGMLRAIVINEETGFIVKNDDVTRLMAQKIDYLLKHPDLLARMKVNARGKIETTFSREAVSSKMFSLIDKCNGF